MWKAHVAYGLILLNLISALMTITYEFDGVSLGIVAMFVSLSWIIYRIENDR